MLEPDFLEVAEHLPALGGGEQILYLALLLHPALALPVKLSLAPTHELYHFHPSDSLRVSE